MGLLYVINAGAAQNNPIISWTAILGRNFPAGNSAGNYVLWRIVPQRMKSGGELYDDRSLMPNIYFDSLRWLLMHIEKEMGIRFTDAGRSQIKKLMDDPQITALPNRNMLVIGQRFRGDDLILRISRVDSKKQEMDDPIR